MPKPRTLTQQELDVEIIRDSILELIPPKYKGKALGMLNSHNKACKALILRDVMSGIFSNRAYIKKKHEL